MALDESSDAIIVLGAQVKESGEPSIALLRRMTLALEHYNNRPRPIICCGAQGADEPMAEGDFMRGWFIERGVPEPFAYSENMSYNTRQNIANAQRIMGEMGLVSALIITSDYHLPRALATAKAAGMPATGDGSLSDPEFWWKNHIRESMSWMKFWLGR
ncbi:hypothetical protein FACS18948_5840 [Clostridia bacterium]|nr:hypothetical protein FACS18948_5840 [Clostridia bacterium]